MQNQIKWFNAENKDGSGGIQSQQPRLYHGKTASLVKMPHAEKEPKTANQHYIGDSRLLTQKDRKQSERNTKDSGR